MFLVVFGPVAIAAIAASLGNDRYGARLTGFLYSIVFVSLLGFARTIPHLHYLVRSDWDTTLPFYDVNLTGFSMISLGILFLFGALASLGLLRSWLLPAAFAFLCFWLNRKTEFVLISASLIAMTLWRYGWRTSALRPIIWSAVSIGLAIVLLHNETNVMNWQLLTKTSTARVEVISAAVSENKAAVIRGAAGKTTNVDQQIPDTVTKEVANAAAFDQKRSKIAEVALGKGLGWYATLGGTYFYPHNSLVESYLETGLFSACLLAAVILFAAVTCLRRAALLHDPKYFALFLMIVGFFVVCMKAGELTITCRLFGLSLIATAFASGIYGTRGPRSVPIWHENASG
jgi:hypothetical protein